MLDHPPSTSPITQGERSGLLDSLRGWALLGVLTANMVGFSNGSFQLADVSSPTTLLARFNEPARFLIEWLVVGKFYALFSLLFGIGFSIQLARLEARGEGVRRYLRRLGVLFLFGLAHLLLIWRGDILALYATMGAVLLIMRRLSDRTLLAWVALFWLFPIAWAAAIELAGFAPQLALRQAGQALVVAAGVDTSGGQFAYTAGPDLWPHLAAHPGESLLRLARLIREMRFTKVLGMFLIGLWIGRHALHVRLDEHRGLLIRVARIGLGFGLPVAALRAWLVIGADGQPMRLFLAEFAYCLSTPTLALGYAASFALLWRAGQDTVLSWTAPAGRMALTNYLAQSVIQSLIFYGYALGLGGKLGLVFVPPLSLALFAFQVALSGWWLARYRFGPCEWLWRSLTYGRAQPMRLERPFSSLRA